MAQNIKYIEATVEDLVGTEEGTCDAVVASEVVEHVADVPTFVTACCQLVKVNITPPPPLSLFNMLLTSPHLLLLVVN